ncbi:fimbria/pilus outer membrane usher protein [Mesorhizobium neociceri]|uniref:Fimbrial biogenesis outer membrane usher protein n=1 Tax=Mesorhizobium neociceri TaxID=1307853 RepID=A0A838BC28_9HYPH|nr:fimbria/pilus outer membrane usher protein [Mesorhizobium neociceri]MBA1143144.1 fimbrial biogenesis outer membrane usher protein [Mesorhizobium neociceri]
MPKLPSRAASTAIIVALATFTPCPAVNSQELPAVTNPEKLDPVLPAGRSLYLEVFINDASTKLIGNFTEMPDGGLAATPQELKEVGLKSPEGAADAGGLVRLDQLADVSFQIDEAAQRLYVTAANDSREARIVDLGLRLQDRPAPQSGYGAVLNYSLFASSNTLFDGDNELFQGISGGFDTRVFSPYGTLGQSFIAGYSDGRFGGFTRLNTTWSYSDPDRLMTYRAGDFVSGGLSWTRPVYLGGIQAQRNFSLRSDLVTLPLPSFGGTAAVPSTLEVYTQNVRTYSGDIQPGPFQVTNLPVFTGAGQAQVVLRDSLGRETTATLPFYASNMLLRQGLLDFSVEAGMARRNFGIASDDYDGRIMGVATARYGQSDQLTLEAHAEGGADLINGGIGAAFPLGPYGAASAAVAGSHHDGRTGSLVDASVEFGYDGWAVNAHMQRAFGGYEDIASVTAQPVLDPDDFARFSAGVPRAIDQVTLSVPMPIDFSSLNLSYTHLKSAEGETSQIVGLSYSQSIFKRSTLYATAFADLDDDSSYGVFAGLSIPFNDDITASTGVEQGPDGFNVVADLAKSEQAEVGSIGWRLRTSEGETPNRSASVSYRALFARLAAAAQQFDKDFRVTGQMDGAIAVAGGGVFATNRIDDAFAVVDVGTPDVEVLHQNRPVGKTDSKGRILVTGLNSYELNTVSIDPKNLPVDADVPTTKETVVPADRNGVVLKFGVSEAAQAALVTLVDASGTPLEAGLPGRLDGGAEDFVVGYDGQAYIKGLARQNSVLVDRGDGSSCRANFPFEAVRGRQVTIKDVVCQ